MWRLIAERLCCYGNGFAIFGDCVGFGMLGERLDLKLREPNLLIRATLFANKVAMPPNPELTSFGATSAKHSQTGLSFRPFIQTASPRSPKLKLSFNHLTSKKLGAKALNPKPVCFLQSP